LLLIPSIAFADETPVPKCEGNDRAAAQRSRALGLQHYRASKRSGAGDPEMTTALGFFDAACAAGDTSALELRAYALAGLDRYVEAAKSLDAFLAIHDMDSLPDDVKQRVEAQTPEILNHVASLTVITKPEGAAIAINHRPAGIAPVKNIRLAAGTYDIEATSERGTQKRTVELGLGSHEEVFDFTPKTEEAPPPPPPPLPPEKPKGKASLVPFIIGGGALAAIGAGIGIGGLAFASGQADSYNAMTCSKMPAPMPCAGLRDGWSTGRAIGVVGLIVGGLSAVTTGILLGVELKKEPDPVPGALACLTGVCTFHF
jgi:hypothetical protein